ncbi:hypothetical protein LXL04_008965 [Taraxacum kok-saghyz]
MSTFSHSSSEPPVTSLLRNSELPPSTVNNLCSSIISLKHILLHPSVLNRHSSTTSSRPNPTFSPILLAMSVIIMICSRTPLDPSTELTIMSPFIKFLNNIP